METAIWSLMQSGSSCIFVVCVEEVGTVRIALEPPHAIPRDNAPTAPTTHSAFIKVEFYAARAHRTSIFRRPLEPRRRF